MSRPTSSNTLDDPGPGVHMVVHPEPLAAARAVARSIGGVLIDLPQMAEAVVTQRSRLPEVRAEAARLARLEALAAGLDEQQIRADRRLADLLDDLEWVAQREAIDDDQATELRRLARELHDLERARRATAERVEARLVAEGLLPDAADLPAPLRPPVSDSVRRSAAVVVAEQAAVADATLALALLDAGAPDLLVGPAPTRQVTLPTIGTDPDPHPESDEVESVDIGAGVATEPASVPDTDAEPDAAEGDAPASRRARRKAARAEAADGELVELLARWDPDAPATTDGPAGDGSFLMAFGVLCMGICVSCFMLFFQAPVVAAAAPAAVAAVFAVITNVSIRADTREKQARADAPADEHSDHESSDAEPSDAEPSDADDGRGHADPDDAVVDWIDTFAESTSDTDEAEPEPEAEADDEADVEADVEATDLTEDDTAEDDTTEDDTAEADAALAAEAERASREQAVTEARERLASALEAWQAQDTDGLDPALVAADPSYDIADRASAPIAGTPEVRALDLVLDQRQDEWGDLWARYGRVAPPPDEAMVDLLVADLRETAPDPAEAAALLVVARDAAARVDRWETVVSDLDGVTLEAARAAGPTAEDLESVPLVLVSPFGELSPAGRRRLRAQLDGLAPDLCVVVVVASADEVPPAA